MRRLHGVSAQQATRRVRRSAPVRAAFAALRARFRSAVPSDTDGCPRSIRNGSPAMRGASASSPTWRTSFECVPAMNPTGTGDAAREPRAERARQGPVDRIFGSRRSKASDAGTVVRPSAESRNRCSRTACARPSARTPASNGSAATLRRGSPIACAGAWSRRRATGARRAPSIATRRSRLLRQPAITGESSITTPFTHCGCFSAAISDR